VFTEILKLLDPLKVEVLELTTKQRQQGKVDLKKSSSANIAFLE
jgi:hypothetical protein